MKPAPVFTFTTKAVLVFKSKLDLPDFPLPEDLPDSQTILESIELDTDSPDVRAGHLWLDDVALDYWHHHTGRGPGTAAESRLTVHVTVICVQQVDGDARPTILHGQPGHLLFSDIEADEARHGWELCWDLFQCHTVVTP